MPTPVSPTKMNATDPKRIGGVWSFIKRFNDLIDWIISLSPAGATLYDTDAVPLTVTGEGLTGTAEYSRIGKMVYIWYDISGTVAGDMEAVALPAPIQQTRIRPAAEYRYGTTAVNPAYASGGSLRIPGQAGVTRRVGTVAYRVA